MMNSEPRISFLGRFSVRRKLSLIPTIFIVAIAGILVYGILMFRENRNSNFVVNLVSRQRALIERYSKEVIMVALGVSTSSGIDARPQETAKLLTNTLNALIHGGPTLVDVSSGDAGYLPVMSSGEVKEKLLQQMQVLERLFADGESVLRSVKSGKADPEKLQQLLESTQKAVEITIDGRKASESFLKTNFDRIVWIEAMIGIIGGLLGWIVSQLIASQIVDPLLSFVSVARNIAAGDLRQQNLKVESSDEIGKLAIVFNEMLQNLTAMAADTRLTTKSLTAAAAQILASTQEQAIATKEQAATVQETSTTMEEINQSGVQISNRAKEVAGIAEATIHVSKSGLLAVENNARSMKGIREQVETVAEDILGLSEKTQAIGDIISKVNDIAEQSKLLALNAAIEAATAGEQGKGFSVVASELKNLADQAKEATVQVRTILGEIQKGINSSVLLAEEAVKRVESGKQHADIAENTIRKVADSTNTSIQAFQQIIGATNQQQIGFDQITQALKNILDATFQTAAGTSQLEKAVLSLNVVGEQLRKSVEKYRA